MVRLWPGLRICLLVALAGCGFTITPGGVPVGSDGGAGSEALVEDGSIDAAPLGPFTSITPLTTLNTIAGEDDPTLTGDLLELYFDRAGDIWFSVRVSTTDTWPAPQALTALNSSKDSPTAHAGCRGGLVGPSVLRVITCALQGALVICL